MRLNDVKKQTVAVASAAALFVANVCLADNAPQPSTRNLTNPLGNGTTIYSILGTVIKLGLGICGTLALLAFVYGGFLMLTSAGDPKKYQKGISAFKYAIIGLAIIFSSYAIVNQIFTLTNLSS